MDNCKKCNKKLKTWEDELCESCKKAFDENNFKQSVEEYAKDYDNYMDKQKAGSQGQQPSDKTPPATGLQLKGVAHPPWDDDNDYWGGY